MRILIISDIHANLTALETVISEAGEFEAVWCLGDLVGYGPDPNECVALVRELPNLKCILGNHDAAALQKIDPNSFNPEARQSLLWTKNTLNSESVGFLNSLPEIIEIDEVTITHGSPRHPIWEYLLDINSATENFDCFSTMLCFVGHTHLPVIFSQNTNQHFVEMNIPGRNNKSLALTNRAILNPGSVGQPRDQDPRAAYAIFYPEINEWKFKRVSYDIPSVQNRMLKANLPERQILRLAAGW
jgi:predicted phosphodiesterase